MYRKYDSIIIEELSQKEPINIDNIKYSYFTLKDGSTNEIISTTDYVTINGLVSIDIKQNKFRIYPSFRNSIHGSAIFFDKETNEITDWSTLNNEIKSEENCHDFTNISTTI